MRQIVHDQMKLRENESIIGNSTKHQVRYYVLLVGIPWFTEWLRTRVGGEGWRLGLEARVGGEGWRRGLEEILASSTERLLLSNQYHQKMRLGDHLATL
jgi:hypothetical protein